MAKTATPAFVQALRTETAIVMGASTDRTDPAAAVELFVAGAEGSNIVGVWAIPRDTVTATELQLYLSPDGGTTLVYCGSALMTAHTAANTTAVPETDFERISEDAPFYLAPGTSLYAAAAVALADGIVFTAIGGDL